MMMTIYMPPMSIYSSLSPAQMPILHIDTELFENSYEMLTTMT